MIVNQFPNRKITIDNEDYLYFGGTAYLGLPTNKKFQKILIKNLKKWGTAYGSSRNANIQLLAYDIGEKYLAKFIKSEAVLTISSGMLAGKLVIDNLENQTDYFYHFPNSHNAIKSKNSLPFFIDDNLNPRLFDNKVEKITVLTDSVPSFCVKPIDLTVLNLIPINKEITLVIDESHSLGILGENGSGIFNDINYPNIKRKIMIASLGKAMGLTGGMIGSDIDFINQIKLNNSYASAAGMNPAFVKSICDSKNISKNQHKKLQLNLKYIYKILIESDLIDFDVSNPLMYPKINKIYQILKENKIIITNFPYPNDAGELNRIVITANHKKRDLRKMVAVLNEIILKKILN